MNFFKTIASRVIAGWIAGGAGYLSVKYGVSVDTDTQMQVATALVGVVIPVMTTVYGVAHKVLDKHLNPGDAASTHIAAVESAEHAELVARDVH